MIPIPIYVAIFVSIPEAIFILLLGMTLFNLRVEQKQSIIIVISIQAVVAYGVRLLPIPFGIHTVIQLVSLCTLVSIFLKVNPLKSVLSIVLGTVIVTGVQGIIVMPLFSIIGFEVEQSVSNPLYNIILAFSSFAICWVLLLIIKQKNYVLMDLNKR